MSETSMSPAERLREELRKYAIISAYLFVCFGVVLLYRDSILEAQGGSPLAWSLALVKALVMGKFILIGDALSVGSRADAHPMLHRIAWKTVTMLLLLIVFKVLEEIIIGWFHDQTVAQVLNEYLELSWIQQVAPELLMLLILIPLISVTEVYRTIGQDRFREIMRGR